MSSAGTSKQIIADRFVLDAESKRGGMGTVWKGRDLRTRRAIALKVLHDTTADQAERFIREGALLADLQHPSIVAYLAHGTTPDGIPYLVMEWLDGENVAERLARQSLTLFESLTLMRATVRGLAVAHRRGVVHRDLKPSNLFLRHGRMDDVVLLDLGVARRFDAPSDLTRTGSIVGTPSYMAPEQAQGNQRLSPAADIFSLGCVLFECLTGEVPFVGAHIFSVLAKVLFEEPPRLRDLRPEMPAAIDALVSQMLMKDPARRPQDASAMLAALDGLGVLPDLGAPGGTTVQPGSMGTEQELVSVMLATRGAERPGTAPDEIELPELPELASYHAEVKSLVDGTTVITLPQRGGSATDLAARAARCALRLRTSRPSWKFVLATGRGIPHERLYLGEAVDRAGDMLRALADSKGESGWASGSIWLDEVTAGLLDARFQTTRPPGAADDGIALFELVGEDPSTDPGRRLLGRPTTCVGRDHELAMLDIALRACCEESSPRAVLVVGPAGIGKSRLRHEMVRHRQLQGDGATVLLGLGDPIRTAGTRGLLGGAVARLCGIRVELSTEEKRAALAERIGRHLGSADDRLRTTVFMAELAGTPYPDDVSSELRAARQNPGIMADLLTQAWLAFLRAEAASRTVVLVLDDLQWSDAPTISLVGAALRELTTSPLLVLALGRPEVLELFPELWAPRLTTLPLQPLGKAATTRLIRQVLGAEISDDSVRRIVGRAGGNALYLEELIRAVEEKRDAIPGTVLAMLQARIGLLPAPARRVLRAASVFGEDFPLAGVEALIRSAEPAEELEPVLVTLQRHEILEQQSDERGGARWRFRHALMRDAAYGLLTAEDLAASHAVAARMLETTGEDPAVIATHHERSGDRGQAVRHYIAAADRAYGRNDLAATVTLVERGLSCGAVGEDRGVLLSIETAARFFRNEFAASAAASNDALQLLPPGNPRRTQSLAWSTYTALHLGKGVEVAAHVEELVAIDPAEGERASYVRALGDVFITHAVLGNRAEASRLLGRIATVDAHAGSSDPLAHGHALYWQNRFMELLGDDLHAAWRHAQAGVSCYQRSGDRRMLAYMQVELGECTRRLFSVSQGMAIMRDAVALAKELKEAVTTSFVQQYLANVLAEHGGPEQLDEARTAALEVIELGGQGIYSAFGQIALAQVHLREGDLDSAEGQARGARARVRQMGLRPYFPHVDGTLMQILMGKGDAAAASELADQALLLINAEGPMGTIEPWLRLVAARAHILAGRRDDATRGVTQALAVLSRRASLIPDAALRERFRADVPEHVALHQLARELGLT